MPELPEVETVRRQLAERITGRRVVSGRIFRDNLVSGMSRRAFLRGITGAVFMRIDRRGKYLVLRLDTGRLWITHLRMTGKFVTAPAGTARGTYVRARFTLDDGSVLDFIDQRTFGTMTLIAPEDETAHFSTLGPEPLGRSFTAAYLQRALVRRTVSVKEALLNQAVVAGIGNIYAAEALFNARIDPRRPAGSLSADEYAVLVKEIKGILRRAIRFCGTTIMNYRGVDNKTGRFVDKLNVYGKAGECCPVCGGPVERIRQGQRSTFFCPVCQR